MGSVKLAAGVFRNEFPDWPDRLRSIFIPVANKHIETGKWIYVSAKANQAGGPGAAFTVLEYQFEQPVFGFRATISPLNEKTEATTEFRIRVDGKILAQYVVNNRGKSFELKSDVPFETLSLESRKLSKRGGNLAIYADPAILVRSGQP